ncbi:signal peptidase I [Sulfurospirillum sp. 1612]|uniref:signal peptidase I n=1 Tax=Sulfurospirillum sp. 1612 TaxID=3094835 RepID=UPI002F9330A7
MKVSKNIIRFKKTKYFLVLLFIGILVGFLYAFLHKKTYRIVAKSMSPTLQVGDILMAKPFSDLSQIKRGDILIFKYPQNIKVIYAKRCVAFGGDQILYADKTLYIRFREGDAYMKKNFQADQIVTFGGKIWVKNPYFYKYPGIHYDQSVNIFQQMGLYMNINQLAMQPALVAELPKKPGLVYNAFYTKVPKNKYFMIGDNRDHSNDSRFWGSIPAQDIVGYAYFANGESTEQHIRDRRKELIQTKLAKNKDLPLMLNNNLQSVKYTSSNSNEITLYLKYPYYTKNDILKNFKDEQDFIKSFSDNEKSGTCALLFSNKNNNVQSYLLSGIKIHEIFLSKNNIELITILIDKESCSPYLYHQTFSKDN